MIRVPDPVSGCIMDSSDVAALRRAFSDSGITPVRSAQDGELPESSGVAGVRRVLSNSATAPLSSVQDGWLPRASPAFHSVSITDSRRKESPEEVREKEIELARERGLAREEQQARKREQAREMVSGIEKEMKESLEMMEPCPGRISELLLETGPGRVSSDHDRSFLAYMKKELSTIVESLRQLSSTELGPEHAISHIKDRLSHLRELATWTGDLLDGYAPDRSEKRGTNRQIKEQNLAWIEQLLLVNAAGHISTALASCDDHRVAPVSSLVGMDGPRTRLLRRLRAYKEEDKGLKVVSIVGPAGVGKTTLAMDAYRQISYEYECRATAKLSQRPLDAKKCLKHIMSQIVNFSALAVPSQRSKAKAMLDGDEYELAYDMYKYLQHKRYLIVIDGIWKTSDWEVLQEAFPHNECGSRIIVTTRLTSLARSCSSYNDGLVHEVKPLSELDSERLFLSEAFGFDDIRPSDHLKQVSDEILRRCDGIPLFTVLMAGLMKKEQAHLLNQTAAYWLDKVSKLKQVEEALFPTYDDLTYELKLLSLYLCTFPWGYKIDKHFLISKWRAEGLIDVDMSRPFDELAHEYFAELLKRDIIRPVTCKYNSEVETCYQVNHFLLQFLVSKAAQIYFVTTSDTLNSTAIAAAAAGGNKIRILQRLSLHKPDPELPALLETSDLSHTHSLTVSGAVNRLPLDKFIHLVMLDLEGWENIEDNDLVHICNSKNILLKYLSIRNTRVSKLPLQITNLEHLETLDISHTNISEIRSEVWELRELRTLDLRGTQVRLLPRSSESWSFLRHLLVNGDKPDERVTETHRIIMYAEDLETVVTLDLSKCSPRFIESLARLKLLEVLAVTWSFRQCYDKECKNALRSAIQKLGRLKCLTIHCEYGCSMEFLDSLSDAPPFLHHLSINARFLTVPRWIQGLNHLAFLQITVCKLMTDDLQLLGSLYRLECLVLGLDFLPKEAIVIASEACNSKDNSEETKSLIGMPEIPRDLAGISEETVRLLQEWRKSPVLPKGFPRLRRFSVDCHVPWLAFGEGAMQELTDFELKLSTGPTSKEKVPSGISNLVSLERVILRYDPWYINSYGVRATVAELRRQVKELGYSFKLVHNGVEEDVEAILDEAPETTETGQIGSKSCAQLQ